MAMTSVTKCLRHVRCKPLSSWLKSLQYCKHTSYSTDAVSFTRRTNTCGSLRHEDVGASVRLCGWLQYHRMGGTFLVLRDWQGLTQLIIPKDKTELMQTVSQLDYETVVEVTGVVRPRPDGQQNKVMITGDIEVQVEDLCVLNSVTPDLPFHIRDSQGQVNEALRMEYRYLDLRSRQMQRNLRLRSKMIMKMREFLANKHGFVDVETPTLFRRTPGGAKEFVVPSRQRGQFYSLPQSPQQFKQLLMVGGIDRYYQVAKCYRDEGSKPDRQPEFTQLDLEMSFVDQEGIIDLIEEMIQFSWPQGTPAPTRPQGTLTKPQGTQAPTWPQGTPAPTTPFPRMTYDQAMRLYGVDKPDTRFDMKLHDITSLMEGCGSKLIEDKIQMDGGAAMAIRVNDIQRSVSNKAMEQMKKDVSAILNDTQSYMITVRVDDSGHWQSPIAKHIHEHTKRGVTMELDLQPGDLVVIATGQRYAPSLAVAPIRKDRNQVFVFVDREPVMLADQYMEQQWNQRHFIDIFNWTFTYRHDSDILYPYGEIVPKPKSSKNTKISSQSMKSIGVKEGVELNKNLKKKTNLMKKPKIGVKSAVNRKKIRVSSDVSKKIEVFNKVMEMNNVHANGAGDKLQSNDISKSTQNIYDDIYNAKTRNVAWVVSHCATSSNRLAFVHEMQEYIDIDIYGRCGNLTIQYKEMGSIFMNKLEKKYRFYLAFENSYETDYATEKLFDWFEKDLIVVVRGAANYSKIVPTNTVVNAADFDTAESLAQYLRILGSEKSRYVGYLRRKSLYKVKTRKEIWKRANCQLCYMLHNVDIYRKSYSHIGKWWKHYD